MDDNVDQDWQKVIRSYKEYDSQARLKSCRSPGEGSELGQNIPSRAPSMHEKQMLMLLVN